MKNKTAILLIVLSASAGLVPVGCDSIRLRRTDKPDKPKQTDLPAAAGEFYLQPLPVQQKQAYAETITGRFVSLADFEDSPILGRGFDQLKHFSISPAVGERTSPVGRQEFVVNITRTGAGAMEVVLPPRSALVYHLPGVHDFSDYTLLMLAVYSRGIRDDLTIRISTDRAGWESLPVLLREGWNNVLIDLSRLKAMKDFQARGVRSIRLGFSDSTEPVRINIDDIMLIDNRREIQPVPEGMRLVKDGLDYVLHLPNRQPVRINQCDDGLWRLGTDQAAMELARVALGGKGGEYLSVMGRWRVGEVEILEHNSVRLRLANTWYFPTEAGEWISLSVRRIRWEYTFYADGRWITDVMLNNAGGEVISAVKITTPAPAVFADGVMGRVKQVERFGGLAGRWCFLIVPETANKKMYEANFVRPGRLEVRIGQRDDAEGDSDGDLPVRQADGFDQSSSCYRLLARAGHCRFKLIPPDGGLADAVVHVAGLLSGRDSAVSVNSEGLALREITRLGDGSVLFILPGMVDKPRWVEVAGTVPTLPVGR